MPGLIVVRQSVKNPVPVKPPTIDQRLTSNLSNHPAPSGGIFKTEKARAPTKPEWLVRVEPARPTVSSKLRASRRAVVARPRRPEVVKQNLPAVAIGPGGERVAYYACPKYTLRWRYTSQP
jgi:hypothetical protein